MNRRAPAPGPTVIGRDAQLARLQDLVDRTADTGATAVVHGGIGSGKTTLVTEVARRATAAGVPILRTGATSGTDLPPYGALHQLVDDLTTAAAGNLAEAFRFDPTSGPDPYPVSRAVRAALRAHLAGGPGLIVVDNLDRIDAASRQVINLLAGQLSQPPALFVLTVTGDPPQGMTDGSVHTIALPPLTDEVASHLLRSQAPALSAEQRRWVVREAGGNPLALRVLADAVADHPVDEPHSRVAVVRAPGVGLDDLPDASRQVLLVAALAPQLAVSELSAYGDLASSLAAGVCVVRDDRLDFRHPLTAVQLRQSSSQAQWESAHRWLAGCTALPSPMRIWHQALATTTPDDALGAQLAASAREALHRDDADFAMNALELATRLTTDPATQVDRLIGAATLAVDLGFIGRAWRLLRWAGTTGLEPLERSVVAMYGELLGAHGARGQRLASEVIDALKQWGQASSTREPLTPLLFRTIFRSRLEDRTRADLAGAVMTAFDDGLLRQALVAHVDPVAHGGAFLATARELAPADVPDPRLLHLVASAASAVWAPQVAGPLARAASHRLRSAGMWGLLAESLTVQASTALRLGNVREAAIHLHEADEVVSGEALVGGADLAAVRAAVEAQFGSEAMALGVLDDARQQAIGWAVDPALVMVELTRGQLLLDRDEFEQAHHSLARLFDPADPTHHPFIAGWAIADLVESAVLGDVGIDALAPIITSWRRIADRTGSLELAGQVALAEALVTDDAHAEQAYLAAAAHPTPYRRARVLLAYGMWLRRNRRVAEARGPLQEAGEILRALGQTQLVQRAERELRAAGVSVAAGPQLTSPLTAQEKHIARLAAEGLSNKEIGAMLSLSPRTVGSHLYRMFPKLGITARTQLRDVLDTESG